MRHNIIFILALVFSALTYAQLGAQEHPGQRSATVQIRVIDEAGLEIPASIQRFTSNGSEFVGHFTGAEGRDIPFGYYDYVLKRPKGNDLVASGRVDVHWPEQLILVDANRGGLSAGAADHKPPFGFVIEGRIDPIPPAKSEDRLLWVRLDAIGGHDHLDVAIDASGRFRIFQQLEGRFLVSVLENGWPLHTEPISFEQGWHSAAFVMHITTPRPDILHITADSPHDPR